MKLFSQSDIEQINRVAAQSKEVNRPTKAVKASSMTSALAEISDRVLKYFKDSNAILIKSKQQLHEYIDHFIDVGIGSIDTETTGLDRIHDHIVGASLYYPGGVECYIPNKHLIPIFDEPYKDQLSYEDVHDELQRLADAKVKLIFANADFDLSMIYKDYKVDLCDVCYYDVILAWRCLKENERDNALKVLYNKYVLKGKGDPMKFNDFFSPELFPYCRPEVARLYAANDAKITYELYEWQLPFTLKDHPKCKKNHLERISDLIWGLEFPLIKVCHMLHRRGVYIDTGVVATLQKRYHAAYDAEVVKLQALVQQVIDNSPYSSSTRRPFNSGKDFNESSPVHVKYLLYTMLNIPAGKNGQSTDKAVLQSVNAPVTNQILAVRSLSKLIGTYVDKLPNEIAPDGKIHAQFKSIGADCITGDSIIPTKQGYRTLKEICQSAGCVEAQHVDVSDLSIVNMHQQAEDVQSVIKYTNYPTIKITTDCGLTLEGTYNHPIMVSKYTSADHITLRNTKQLRNFWNERRFKRLDEIAEGDYVEVPCNYWIGPTGYVPTEFKIDNKNSTLPEYYTEDFAEFLGMYAAAGITELVGNNSVISICTDDSDVINRVRVLSAKLFNVDTLNDIQFNDNTHSVQVACDTSCVRGYREAIWSSPRSVINSYIRGMTLASNLKVDNHNRSSLELNIRNSEDARLIQYHLLSQGILCSMNHVGHDTYDRTERLIFDADNHILFRIRIGFVEQCKQHAPIFRRLSKNKYRSRRIGDSFRLKVKSIEYSRNTVYDLHVPGTHSFVSNGLISHNTGRMSSQSPNLQNIPSHAEDIRHMFRSTPPCPYVNEISEDNILEAPQYHQIQLSDGSWRTLSKLLPGDVVQTDSAAGTTYRVSEITPVDSTTSLRIKFCNSADSAAKTS